MLGVKMLCIKKMNSTEIDMNAGIRGNYAA